MLMYWLCLLDAKMKIWARIEKADGKHEHVKSANYDKKVDDITIMHSDFN